MAPPPLVALLVALLALVYLRYHVTCNPRFEVLQLDLAKLQPAHLFEKSPVLITDRVVNPMSLLPTAFRYAYTFKELTPGVSSGGGTNRSQYALLAAAEDGILRVTHPRGPGVYEPLDMVVRRHQVLVLPRLWAFDVRRGAFHVVRLDTLLSRCLRGRDSDRDGAAPA